MKAILSFPNSLPAILCLFAPGLFQSAAHARIRFVDQVLSMGFQDRLQLHPNRGFLHDDVCCAALAGL